LSRIRKLDFYVALTFLGPVALCLVGFAGLFVVIDLFSNIDEFFGERSLLETLRLAAVYYMLRLPVLFARIMPIFTVVPGVICMIRLLRSNEICAMRASGISERLVLAPVLCCAAAIAVLAAANQELLVPALHDPLIVAERRARQPKHERIDQALVDDHHGRLFLIGSYHPRTPLPTLTHVRVAWDDKSGVGHKKKAGRAFAPQMDADWRNLKDRDPQLAVWYMEDTRQFDGRLTLLWKKKWEPRGPERFVSQATAERIREYRKSGGRANVPLMATDKEPFPVSYDFGGYTESGETWPVARDVVISHPREPDMRVEMMVWAGDRWLMFGAWTLEAADPEAATGAAPPETDGRELKGSITPAGIEGAGSFKGGSAMNTLPELIAAGAKFGEHSTFRQRCWVIVWNRLAFPLANIVLVMLTVPLVLRQDAHAALVGLSLAVAMTFAFMAVNFISIDLAYRQQLMWKSPAFAGTFPTLLFAAVGIWLFAKMEKV